MSPRKRSVKSEKPVAEAPIPPPAPKERHQTPQTEAPLDEKRLENGLAALKELVEKIKQ